MGEVSTKNRFYVYVYLDMRKSGRYCCKDICFLYEPFYVGKGQKQRYLDHLRYLSAHCNLHFKNKLYKILNNFSKQDIEKYIIIYKSNLSEKEALDLETKLIKEIGRADLNTGPLTNLTEGGEAGPKMVGNKNPAKRLEVREKLSQNHIDMSGDKNPMFGHLGEKCPNFGKKRSEATKKKISEALKGRKKSEEHRKKLVESRVSMVGKNNPMFGKKHSEETRKKISESLKKGRKIVKNDR